jgi:succinate-semialdehyde dehydrogenase/glutarate-semialdehyde dehydrogenase
MEDGTDIGPLATEEVRDALTLQVKKSVEMGARVLFGGETLDRAGFYFCPTVLADIPPGSPAATEELFGPVASLFRARDIAHAIELANATQFGLGASVWTNEATERDRFISDLESGCVFINSMVASDPRLPFGGVKKSGYGRELGRFGMHEFVNIKTISSSTGRSKSVTE